MFIQFFIDGVEPETWKNLVKHNYERKKIHFWESLFVVFDVKGNMGSTVMPITGKN